MDWKQYRQKIKPKIRNFYVGFMLALSLLGLISSCFFFFTGFHNMDWGQNMRVLECSLNVKLIDQIDHNKYWDGTTGYIWGVKQIFLGFFLGLVSSFLMGIHLSILKVNGAVFE